MYLERLQVFNFKNYSDTELNLDVGINCFLGKNGSGKTNLLDAIHYLSFTKSAINNADTQNIRWNENQGFIKGLFDFEGVKKVITLALQTGLKKVIKEDGLEYARYADHVGKYPLVIITPQDIELIWGSGEERRRFFDTLICQLDRQYLDNLMIYNHQIKQRNSMLKRIAEQGKLDADLLDTYDEAIVPRALAIHEKRREVINSFKEFFTAHYEFIAGEKAEQVSITYKSDLNESDIRSLLIKNRERDLLLQRTSTGIHRDDFIFRLKDNDLKKTGSQGQQKSYLIALKLTEFQLISQIKGFKPLLLLDDIFDKLDDTRIARLMKLVADGRFGQLFITDARLDRTLQILGESDVRASVFQVINGNLTNYV